MKIHRFRFESDLFRFQRNESNKKNKIKITEQKERH